MSSNIVQFRADLRKFAKAIDASVEQVMRIIVLEAFARIVMRSPVDTGRFRSSWTIQESFPNTVVKPDAKYPPPSPPSFALSGPFTIVWINNSLPYAERLEFGYSKQAPAGMVRLTAAEMEAFMAQAVKGL